MEPLYYRNGVIYNIQKVRDAHPNLSLPFDIDPEFAAGLGFIPVDKQEKYADTEVQYVIPWNREENGMFVMGWQMVDKAPEVVAAEAAAVQTELERQELKADTLIQNFISKTPAELNTYINDTVVDLASAKQIIKLMARILLVIAKREYC